MRHELPRLTHCRRDEYSSWGKNLPPTQATQQLPNLKVLAVDPGIFKDKSSWCLLHPSAAAHRLIASQLVNFLEGLVQAQTCGLERGSGAISSKLYPCVTNLYCHCKKKSSHGTKKNMKVLSLEARLPVTRGRNSLTGMVTLKMPHCFIPS